MPLPADLALLNPTQKGLGSMSEAFDANGNETAAQLYTPYGTVRYATGTMPTAKGFTGQRADVATGLDYYGARYYDAQAGQFVSADSVADGLSPYAYVAGNPETATDPSGHLIVGGAGQGGGNSGCADGSQNCSGGCTSDANCGCYSNASNCNTPPTLTRTPPCGSGGAKACTSTKKVQSDCTTDACKAAKAREELTKYFEHQRLEFQTVIDIGLLVFNLAILGVDLAAALGGNQLEWVNVVADFLALAGSAISVGKDAALLGGASLSDVKTLSTIGTIINGLAAIANAMTGFGFFAFGVGGALKTGMKQLFKVIKPLAQGMLLSLIQAGGATELAINDNADAQEGSLAGENLQQLQQECVQFKVSCS